VPGEISHVVEEVCKLEILDASMIIAEADIKKVIQM